MGQDDARKLLRQAKLKRKLQTDSKSKHTTEPHQHKRQLMVQSELADRNQNQNQNQNQNFKMAKIDFANLSGFIGEKDGKHYCILCRTKFSQFSKQVVYIHSQTESHLAALKQYEDSVTKSPIILKDNPATRSTDTTTISAVSTDEYNAEKPESINKNEMPAVLDESVASMLPPGFFDSGTKQPAPVELDKRSDTTEPREFTQSDSLPAGTNIKGINDIESKLQMLQREISTLPLNTDYNQQHKQTGAFNTGQTDSTVVAGIDTSTDGDTDAISRLSFGLQDLDAEEISSVEREEFNRTQAAAEESSWSSRLNSLRQLRDIVYEINTLSRLPDIDEQPGTPEQGAQDLNNRFQTDTQTLNLNSNDSNNMDVVIQTHNSDTDVNTTIKAKEGSSRGDSHSDSDSDEDMEVNEDDPEVKNYMMGWLS